MQAVLADVGVLAALLRVLVQVDRNVDDALVDDVQLARVVDLVPLGDDALRGLEALLAQRDPDADDLLVVDVLEGGDAAQNLELRMPVLVHGVAVSGDVFVPVERALVILAPKRRLGLVKLFQAGEDIRIVRVAFRLGTE